MARNSISTIVVDRIGPRLEFLALGLIARAEVAMRNGASEVEEYGRDNAPWSDRTGDARQGLTAEVSHEGTEIVLTFGHTVDYGVWLELIQDGAFAIILPTLEAIGPEILERVGKSIVGISGSIEGAEL